MMISTFVLATALAVAAGQTASPQDRQEAPPADPPVSRQWQFVGFADIGCLFDFNKPVNKLWRSRGTTFRVDDLHLNMMGAYARRTPSERSPWGVEFLVHTGKDDEIFGFSATAPNMAGSEWLRHIGLANVSYVAPVGKGLRFQGGIFTSLIGYDSLYAKDNANYTRPWGADFTPYLMAGINVSYPFTTKLIGTFYVINGYWHLANANRVPSSGLQLAYRPTPQITVKETVLAGPHQSNTSLEFWRYLSDTIVEHRTDRVVMAFDFHFSTEVVDSPSRTRAWWVAAQVPIRWNLRSPLSIALRPEFAWDSDGRWTLAAQTVKAMTSTVEYHAQYNGTGVLVKLEHRFDVSGGPDGGFFHDGQIGPEPVPLTPTQHLLVFGLILTFDSASRR